MRRILFVAFAAVIALSSTIPTHAATATEWNSQTKISGVVTIPADTIVTVAAGTKINVAPGAKIIVAGQLHAPQGLSLTSSRWQGLVVSGLAVLTDFEETGATRSFHVTSTGSLTINGGNISGVRGSSLVDGNFTAKNLRYDKGSGNGITSEKASGVISVDGGFFTGSARGAGDFFSLSAGRTLSVTNSTITKVHCAFHITGVENMKLDGVVMENNAFGFMMYGSSDTGVRTITNTTITNNDFGFDEGSSYTKNGVIKISNSYIKNNKTDLGLFTKKVIITSPATKAIVLNPKTSK